MDYIQIISKKFPNVRVSALGAADDYQSLRHDGGDPIPSEADLEAARKGLELDAAWRAIQAERDLRKSGGVRVGTNWFHSDDTSRIQQIGLVMFGANMPPGIMWKTMQGTFVAMTPTLASQIFQSIAGQDQSIFGRAEQHRAASVSAPSPRDYDFSGGWPQTFEEWKVAPAPVASFTTDATSGVSPLTVTFTDTSTNSPTSWTWDFGDGTTGTGKTVTKTYATAGTFTVIHTASNASRAGTGSVTMTDLITTT